ncbi:PCP reductase family protein [Dolichospermum sp. UHCC 0684]|uniref:PCP reductase family protein n=1 Tax=Nostocales TaxID=1161 RepID=UPI00029B6D20|nr:MULTISPECIES: PCP reductase family protein [Nostocales]AFW93064.1 protochlorophyllide reductase [Anabaena sp. 90]MEA5531889.1 PCP reductase family protein [Dolichospermum sp. UHCC 0684]MTJ16005.1 protochlorophyllide oxidoreductase [Dolichospermum sp. UHCC 0299]MTJ22328.1 protochlorophyllide oxidoreductase [Dolichospermum sp. UHCC 0352]MTJ35647.1 protochlorophyllide oxidoreductase [Dolichospermum sp. UHCC 0260]
MSEQIKWTAEAEVKLKEIPFFVRPFARKKIETYAQENSISLITLEIYEQVKQQFNKKFG